MSRISCEKVALGRLRIKSVVFIIAVALLGLSSTSTRKIRNIEKAPSMSSL
jgi:hypothetical protein